MGEVMNECLDKIHDVISFICAVIFSLTVLVGFIGLALIMFKFILGLL